MRKGKYWAMDQAWRELGAAYGADPFDRANKVIGRMLTARLPRLRLRLARAFWAGWQSYKMERKAPHGKTKVVRK